jgi:hypothetical protein
VQLDGADLSESIWSKTSVARCPDLSRARGLDRLILGDESAIDIHSLRASIAGLCREFLAHVGLSPDESEGLAALLAPADPSATTSG